MCGRSSAGLTEKVAADDGGAIGRTPPARGGALPQRSHRYHFEVAETGGGQEGYPRLGSMFGRYRIDSIIGRGGMGIVFRATDVELERPVALKLLTPELADVSNFRARFVRESRMAAAIDHPNIVPIYDAGEAGGILYLAMRYIPSQDLGAILRTDAPLEKERALAIVSQISDALDAAHRRGLVHRDVKPGNILLESNGLERAYLADFGLTRRVIDSPKWSTAGLLGTIDYMSPEQIEGQPIDGRTDQYALACVLFHCLGGRPPFDDANEATILFAHVNRERPRLSELRPDLGTRFDAVLARGMAKAPADRYPTCGAFADAATEASLGKVAVSQPVPPEPLPDRSGRTETVPVDAIPSPATSRPLATRRAWRPAALASALVAGSVVVGLVALRAVPAASVPSPSMPVTPSSGSFAMLSVSPATASISPSSVLSPGGGGVIVFASDHFGNFDLYRIDPDGSNLRALTHTPRDETNPVVSPDGSRIAFAVGGVGSRDIVLMNPDGSDLEPLTSDPGDDYAPDWSPDGSKIAFCTTRTGNSDIYVMADKGSGFAESRAQLVTDNPAIDQFPAWSGDGSLIAISTNRSGNADIWVVRADQPSVIEQLTRDPDADLYPAWPATGARLAFVSKRNGGDRDIFLMNADGTHQVRLTESDVEDIYPDFAPDGSAVVYQNGVLGHTELLVAGLAGGKPVPLTVGMADAIDPDWATALR
jgi:serine/threonine protein kinase